MYEYLILPMSADGLCPKIPLKMAGIRIEPAISDPMPTGEPAAANRAPSPPLEPPGTRFVSYGLRLRPKMLLDDSHLQIL